MVEKEKKPHETLIEQIHSKNKAKDAYLFVTKFEHETFLYHAKNEIFKKVGADKALEYLRTRKGQVEFAKLGSEKLEELAIKRYGIDKSKIHEFDLSRLVQNLYGVNKSVLQDFMDQTKGELDFGVYQKAFLDKHLEKIESEVTQNHVLNFDPEHIPAVLKHIGADKYFKDLNVLKSDRYKGAIANAILYNDKGKNPLGSSQFSKDKDIALLMKDQYRKEY